MKKKTCIYEKIFALKTSAYLNTLAAQFFKNFLPVLFIVFIADVSRESYESFRL